MRYIRYAFLALIALCLITVALANKGAVGLKLLPQGVEGLVGFNYSIELPLFIVIYGGIVAGLLIGFVWEWLREHKNRAEAGRAKKDVRRLEREVTRLKGTSPESKDDVLALLEEPR